MIQFQVLGKQKTKQSENEQKHEAFSSFLMLKLYFSLKTLMINKSLFLHSPFLVKFVAFTLNYNLSTGHGLGKLWYVWGVRKVQVLESHWVLGKMQVMRPFKHSEWSRTAELIIFFKRRSPLLYIWQMVVKITINKLLSWVSIEKNGI